ncbi:MAG: hypothetical protein QOJ80_7204 [Mycobacterium sp.]|jgi:hypothetical protein|nr:hypothetical protein [Mycobacterium sp.]
MTTVDHRITISSKWRPLAVAAIFVAAMSVAAATADAKPKQTAGQQYDQCVIDAVKYNVDHGTTPDMNLIQGGCCGYIGGTIVTADDGVTFKDCIYPDAPAGQPTPPPGGTAVLHPGENTRAGDQ